MQNNIEEKISMLLDDELSSKEAIALLEKIDQDDQLRQIWYRYNNISLALKSDQYISVDSQLSDHVKKSIEVVPTVLAPNVGLQGPKKWVFALAASVVFIAVFSWPRFFSDLETPAEPITIAEHLPEPLASPELAQWDEELDSRLNDYLVTHNESAYSTGMQGMLPYARVVGYSGQ